MGIAILIFLCVVGGLEAAQDFKNQSVECSFKESDQCFNKIADLGGNFSAKYADSKELNKTCMQIGSFKSCMRMIPQQCDTQNPKVNFWIDVIEKFVTKLCANGSVEQNSFLNSSDCYNKNLNRRQRCVQKYFSTKTDAKSLCCKSKKTQECLNNDLTSVCSSNSTVFQDMLIGNYSGYTNFLCEPYMKYCSNSVVNFLSVTCLLFTAKLTFLNIIRYSF